MNPYDQLLMEKALNKAVQGGLEFFSNELLLPADVTRICANTTIHEAMYVIFSHRFAKAFWGEHDQWPTTNCTCGGLDPHIAGPDIHKTDCAKALSSRGYLFHLKQLAITPQDERLKYIEQFL